MNDDIKKYIWVATTIIVMSIFLASGHIIFSLLVLAISYTIWNAKAK